MPVKKIKTKIEKKPSEPPAVAKPATVAQASIQAAQQQQQQPQILTILQQPQVKTKADPHAQQIILSMSQAQAMIQAQQQKGTVYTFPTNLILNANGSFMTNAGEVVGNFKFEGQ